MPDRNRTLCPGCLRPLTPSDLEDSEAIGRRTPHCQDCNDGAVLGE